jgi:hypothetical protein
MFTEYILFPVMGNTPGSGNKVLARIPEELAARLPRGWKVRPGAGGSRTADGPDARLKLVAGDGTAAALLIEARQRVEPRSIPALREQLRGWTGGTGMLVAPYLSPATREGLLKAEVNYLDFAGNLRLVVDRPALYVYTVGAARNPSPEERPGWSLKGATAGRVVRVLCDFLPPVGIRELASRASTTPGYASRLVERLDAEALLTRARRGPVQSVDWQALLRRWAKDYTPFARPRARSYLAPRGLLALEERLRASRFRHAVTGGVAAARLSAAASPRLFAVYVDDAEAAASGLGLQVAETGANVLLLSPFDPVVYERGSERGSLRLVAPSQIAADLLTSPGRGPAEADAFMAWMAEHERAWRA